MSEKRRTLNAALAEAWFDAEPPQSHAERGPADACVLRARRIDAAGDEVSERLTAGVVTAANRMNAVREETSMVLLGRAWNWLSSASDLHL